MWSFPWILVYFVDRNSITGIHARPVVGTGKDGKGALDTFRVAALGEEKPHNLFLLFIEKLTDSVSESSSGTLIPHVRLTIPLIKPPVPAVVEEHDPSEDAVLGPIPNHVSNTIWIILVGGECAMCKQRGEGPQGRKEFRGVVVSFPERYGLDIQAGCCFGAMMMLEILKQMKCNLVECVGGQLDQSHIEGTRGLGSSLIGSERL